MSAIKGKLTKDDIVIEDDILFSINIRTTNNFTTWEGSSTIKKTTKIQVGEIYSIELIDERKGKIIIKNLKVNNVGDKEIVFIGTGPLI